MRFQAGNASLAAWTASSNSLFVMMGILLTTSCVACTCEHEFHHMLQLAATLAQLLLLVVTYRVLDFDPVTCLRVSKLSIDQHLGGALHDEICRVEYVRVSSTACMRFTEQHLTDSAGLGAGCEANSLLGLALPAQSNREPIGPYCARVARLASGKTAVNKRSMLTQRVDVTGGRSASDQCSELFCFL